MAWPPAVLAVDKVNTTAQQNDHPAHHNAIAGAINDLRSLIPYKPTYCRVYKTASTQTIPNTTPTPITWDGETEDLAGVHGANSSRFTIPAGLDGIWQFTASIIWNGASAGFAVLRFWVNGATTHQIGKVDAKWMGAGDFTGHQSTFTLSLAAGDFVEAVASQNSGGGIALIGAANPNEVASNMTAVRLGSR